MQLSRAVRRRLALRCARARDERGFTLIELLVVIAILSIIVVPLTEALGSYFRNTDQTTKRLSVSHDAQIAAAYFSQDVASVGRHDWNSDGYPLVQSVYQGPSTSYPCGTGSTQLLLLWDDPTASGKGLPAAVLRVSYTQITVNGQKELHRQSCDKNGNTKSDVTLAHYLSSVSVNCSSTCTDQAVPQTIQLTLNLSAPDANGPNNLTVTLTGQRRQT